MSPTVDATERRAAAEVLVRAFETDAGWAALVPDPRARRAVLGAMLRSVAPDTAPGQTVLVARSAGDVVGAAVAWRPGHHPSVLRMSYLRAAGTMLRIAPLATVPAWRRWRALRAADRHHAEHWHLAFIGVAPELQRKGVGRMLLAAFLALGDEDGSASYLETSQPDLVGWYSEAGFRVAERLALPTGSSMWTMLRDPRGPGG